MKDDAVPALVGRTDVGGQQVARVGVLGSTTSSVATSTPRFELSPLMAVVGDAHQA
ncbi:hypothetical protein [Streptomyces globosus]|uniref:hypothetical protein n=1 Tax=Streptomyces globosus TaxID=68209 RepID=UPI00362F3CE1